MATELPRTRPSRNLPCARRTPGSTSRPECPPSACPPRCRPRASPRPRRRCSRRRGNATSCRAALLARSKAWAKAGAVVRMHGRARLARKSMVLTPGWRAQPRPDFKCNPSQRLAFFPMNEPVPTLPRSPHLRRYRPHQRRRAAGRPARAREHGLLPPFGGHRAHRPGHRGRRIRPRDRPRLGRRPGALHPRGHAGGRLQDGHARLHRDRDRGRRGGLRLSRTCPLVLDPVLRLRPRRRVRRRRHGRGDPRAAGAAKHGGHAQHRGAAAPRRRRRRRRCQPRRMRPAPARHAAASTCS